MVEKGYPAEKAGLKSGYQIEKIISGENEIKGNDADELRNFLKEHPKNIEIFYREVNDSKIKKTPAFDLKENNGSFLAGVYFS
jgi:C-terminal processing protease CtpA/Prc